MPIDFSLDKLFDGSKALPKLLECDTPFQFLIKKQRNKHELYSQARIFSWCSLFVFVIILFVEQYKE